jgi:hypothetical protein
MSQVQVRNSGQPVSSNARVAASGGRQGSSSSSSSSSRQQAGMAALELLGGSPALAVGLLAGSGSCYISCRSARRQQCPAGAAWQEQHGTQLTWRGHTAQHMLRQQARDSMPGRWWRQDRSCSSRRCQPRTLAHRQQGICSSAPTWKPRSPPAQQLQQCRSCPCMHRQ